MHRNLLAECDPDGIDILLRSDDQELVTFLKHGIRSRNRDQAVPEDPGNHNRVAKIPCGVLDGQSEDGRILYLAVHASCHILVIVLAVKSFLLLVEIDFEYGLEEHDQRDHQQHSQRIGDRVGGGEP